MEKPRDRRALALGLFHTLSDELICCVLELLAAKDLAILSCVSSVFYIFCNEDPLWMKLCLQSHEGLLRYAGSWKHTALEKLNNVQQSSHASSNTKLHFDGFSSLFLYRQWYRCNVNLSYFGTDCGMIDRRHGLSLEEFVSDYDGKKPLLLDGLADRWPAMQRWSIDNLAKNYGKCLFKVAQNDEKNVLMRFEDYASYISQQHDEDPLYIFDPKFGEVAPDLIQDYQVPNFFKEDLFSLMDDQERPPFRWLVIGPARSGASWHVDPALTSAWNTLLRGRKRWALYPPGRVPPSVIVHADEEDGDVDVDSPSSLQWWLDVYPALKDEDKPLECIQLPGETIFVPSGWWHCVLNLDTSVAVTQNFVNSTNLELVCLDLTPGYRHRGVARAGRLALQEASAVIDSISKGSIKESDKLIVMGAYQRDWNFTVDFLASFVDQDSNHFLYNPMKSGFLRSQSVRKWLQRLWLTRPDLRQKVWKGACILLDAKSWLERVISICDAHDLPRPTEAEQLPVGNGSNPVFLVGRYVVKLCLDEASEDKAIDGLSSELHFYSELKECGSPLKHAVPDLVASGVVYFEDGTYTAVAWDGKNEPQDKYHKRQKASLRLGEFHRARWNQAVLNPLYLEPCEDDSLEAGDTASLSYPYIITDRCEGEDFAHMRARMGESHILALASFLGEHIHNLHCLPLPPVSPFANSADKPGEVQKILETNGMIGNVDDNQQKAWICMVPGEWNLFINMMRRQREHAITRLQAWDCVPTHLITQVEDYLPSDPVLLAGVHKVIQGVAQMGQPVWLHMDVTDENIQVVPGTLTENKHHTEHTDADRAVVESIDKIRACYILDFGDVCLGDPLYELVSIYLDVFQGNSKFVKCFLASYRLSLSPKSGPLWTLGKGWNKIECVHQLPYRAMCYSILHEENALGAVFSIWKELKLASTWKEVEQKVWGFLTEYDNEDLHLLHDQM